MPSSLSPRENNILKRRQLYFAVFKGALYICAIVFSSWRVPISLEIYPLFKIASKKEFCKSDFDKHFEDGMLQKSI